MFPQAMMVMVVLAAVFLVQPVKKDLEEKVFPQSMMDKVVLAALFPVQPVNEDLEEKVFPQSLMNKMLRAVVFLVQPVKEDMEEKEAERRPLEDKKHTCDLKKEVCEKEHQGQGAGSGWFHLNQKSRE